MFTGPWYPKDPLVVQFQAFVCTSLLMFSCSDTVMSIEIADTVLKVFFFKILIVASSIFWWYYPHNVVNPALPRVSRLMSGTMAVTSSLFHDFLMLSLLHCSR